MDKLRNQAFPSQRSQECFHKKFLIKIQMKTDCVKTIGQSVWIEWKLKDQKKVN